MPPRRGRNVDGAVRGPTSALTSFLAGLGVEAPAIQNPYATRDDPSVVPIVEDDEPELSATPPGRGGKRRRAVSVDSDDLDADDGDEADDDATAGPSSRASVSAKGTPSGSATPSLGLGAPPGPLKAVGEFMNCGECGRKFPVTVYTKEHPRRPKTWLCTPCCKPLGIDPYARPKKPRAAPQKQKKDARNKIVHYEVAKGAPLLSDTCIGIIGKYIEEVDALGEIGPTRMDTVCKVISKNRRLTPDTAALFYSAGRTELSMYDVTTLDHNAFVTLGNLCPNLESLNLQYCGQMMTDTLIHWSKQLRHLKHLELFGPFLVRKEGWLTFFEARGKQLESLSITQSPRIDLETMEVLVKQCPNLRVLKLGEIGQLDSEFLVPMASLKKLEELAIISPGTAISDDAVIDLLSAVGSKLTSLDLSYNPELGDDILPVIAEHCPKLTHLTLAHVDLSDDAVGRFFKALKTKRRPGLVHINFEKGHDLAHNALRALIAHSGQTVRWLSLMGWRNVPAEDVEKLAACPELAYLDLGWCRHITDFTVKDILEGCGALTYLRVWGCNNLTDRVPRKRGVKVAGVETHPI